jgi:CheY-like chemotaxis protein
MTSKRVLNVGQCFADQGSISRTLRKAFDVEVISSDTIADAVSKLRQESFALVLVNRILDADGSHGLELIRQVRADEALKEVPVMLVSNYEDSQQEAVAAGAVIGFGKAALGQPHMLGRVKPYLT